MNSRDYSTFSTNFGYKKLEHRVLAAREPQTVIDIFQTLPCKFEPATDVYTTIVNAYVDNQEYAEAIKVWDKTLSKLKFVPDKGIYIALIIAAIYCDDLHKIGLIIDEMRKAKIQIDMEFNLGLISKFKEENVHKKLEILYFKIVSAKGKCHPLTG